MPSDAAHSLIPLGEGVYSVSEVCRILQPTMTPRKVHYWLDTGLLSEPIYPGRRGQPTLLSFQQLLEIRTVQRLRDELRFSLPRVRSAFDWILQQLFASHWRDLHFERVGSEIAARAGRDFMVVPGGQGLLDFGLHALNSEIASTREAWERKLYVVPDRPYVVSNARVLAGAPTVRGTRVETAFLASFADNGAIDQRTLDRVVAMYGALSPEAVHDALAFEGISIAA